MTLETPALMAEAVAGPFRGLTLTAPVADVAVDDLIDLMLVLARRLAPYVDDLADNLADVIIDLDAEAVGVDDLDHDDVTYWCSLYVSRTPIPPS